MLDRGVDIDALTDFVKIQGRDGDRRKSHLHFACSKNCPSVARVLLLHGADMFCAHNHFNYGKTPLDYVRTFCHSPYNGDMKELIALFDRAAPSHWRRLFALTFGQLKTRAVRTDLSATRREDDARNEAREQRQSAFDRNRRQRHDYSELAGQRIKPLIGAFLVGDVLQKKRS